MKIVANNICELTIEIGYAPTANFYWVGTINSDVVFSTNNSVEFICTYQINLLKGYTVEKSADFLTDNEACE